MKKTKRTLCVLLCLLLTVCAAVPAGAASNPAADTRIEEVFTYDLFCDAAVNKALAVFPQLCAGFETLLAESKAPLEAAVRQALAEEPFNGCKTVSVSYNGADGTAPAADFLAAAGIYVYPRTLGAFLRDRGYDDAAAKLLAARDGWDTFLRDGEYVFDIDWGVDDTPALRNEAFTSAVGALLDAAPMLKAMLGTEDFTAGFGADAAFCSIAAENVSIKISFVPYTTELLTLYGMTGTLTFAAGNVFNARIVPAYRCLGLGSVIPCRFARLSASMTGVELAEAVFGPLYTLVDTVQNDFRLCCALVDFYASEAPQLLAELPDWATAALSAQIEVDGFSAAFGAPLYEALASTGVLTSMLAEKVLPDLRLTGETTVTLPGPYGKAALASLLGALYAECPAGSHDFMLRDYDETVHVYECMLCGYEYYAPHTFYVDGATPPTCVDAGYTGDRVCAECGRIERSGEFIPPVGHVWDAGVLTAAPTCTEDGVRTFRCMNCGEEKTETLPALGHTAPNARGRCGRCGELLRSRPSFIGGLIDTLLRLIDIFKRLF